MTALRTSPTAALPRPESHTVLEAPPGPVWVVVPTYDEAENLEPLVRAVRGEVPDATVLVVDDASPDGTGDLADALAAVDDRVRVLHRPEKAGLGGAYVEGYGRALAAGAGVLCQLDADFSHDPGDLRRLLAAAGAGADMVIGSRYITDGATAAGWSPLRRALSRGAGVYARSLLGLRVSDPTSGFRCYRAPALRELDLESVEAHGFAFQVELTHRARRAGLRIAEVPITFGERHAGHSKMSAAIGFEALWRIPAWRRRA